MRTWHLVLLLLVPCLAGQAHAHTVDAVGGYRVEIGWMNEPVVSGETNALEFYASPLDPCPGLGPIKCAESQPFAGGVTGLEDTVKMELVFRGESIRLPLAPDHDVPGKYHAFVNPTVSGFYQANVLGTIRDTPISLSMHPPKVAERSYIEFPEPADLTVTQMIDGHTALIDEVGKLRGAVDMLGDPGAPDAAAYAGMGAGAAGVALAAAALVRSRR